LLLQLRESLKVYHGLKGKYELLMEDLHQLETEKSNLAKLLDQSKIDPLDGSSLAIRKRLEKVEINLSRARRETLDHRQKQRFAENQARKCKILERKVNELKNTKSSLMKKQKQDAVRYKKTTEAKTNELLLLKRRAKITDKRMSKLENELNLQKKNYSKQTHYCSKLSEKLKNTEKYLVNLLAIRQSNLSENRLLRKHQLVRQGGRNIAKSESAMRSLSEEEIKATKYIFDRMVSDKVKKRILKKKYEEAVAAYSETMRKVLSEGKALKNAQARINDDHNQSLDNRVLMKDLEDNIVNFELKLELIESELQELSAQLPNSTISSEKDIEDAVRKLLTRMSPSVLKSTLLETFSKFVQVEVCYLAFHIFF
jgi:DNA repair exonuclease SbcCD ATPase subunit